MKGVLSLFTSEKITLDTENCKRVEEYANVIESLNQNLKAVQKKGRSHQKIETAHIDEERMLLGDSIMELGRIFKAAYDDPLAILLGECVTGYAEFHRSFQDARSTMEGAFDRGVMKAVDNYIAETEKAKELLKEHQKKIDAYAAAKAKTAKEKSAKKQNPIKVVEAEREESGAKQVLEDSERELLGALQTVLKKNNKEMLALVTSAYVSGLQAYFATGVEKVHNLKAQLHEKIRTDEPDPNEPTDEPQEQVSTPKAAPSTPVKSVPGAQPSPTSVAAAAAAAAASPTALKPAAPSSSPAPEAVKPPAGRPTPTPPGRPTPAGTPAASGRGAPSPAGEQPRPGVRPTPPGPSGRPGPNPGQRPVQQQQPPVGTLRSKDPPTDPAAASTLTLVEVVEDKKAPAANAAKAPSGNELVEKEYKWDNGDKYQGQFKGKFQHGRGTLWYASGNKYEGEWKDGQRHGRGLYSFANGDKYEGEYWENKKHGYGVFTFTSGEKYEGMWRDDKQHGKGKYTYASGNTYDGEWLNDEKSGIGTYTWTNGDKYEGRWRANKKHGQGKMIYADGETALQWYDDGKMIKEEGDSDDDDSDSD